MNQVIVEQFGGVEQLHLVEVPTPEPGPGQVRVRLTSIGMNHADLMARRGEYRLASGEPPFTPGLEGGGVIEAIGPDVTSRTVGERVVLGPDVPRLGGPHQPGSKLAGAEGTYRTHYICNAADAYPAPENVPDEQLGCLWLGYLTAWGCLAWKQRMDQADGEVVVALPAASSGVALAAAQIIKCLSPMNTVIGLTSSPEKMDRLTAMPEAVYDHLVATAAHQRQPLPWHRDIKGLTDGRGVDVFFDPIGAGSYLETEIRCLAPHGTVWIYGLLGGADKVDLSPLIRKHASVRGWALSELISAGREAFEPGCRQILAGLANGDLKLYIAESFALEDVRHAHETMEKGVHIGKLVLVP